MLNYFLTAGPDPARGATTPRSSRSRRQDRRRAIEALGADVVTLMEIEDTDSTGHSPGNADAALADLVSRLNAAAGYDVWSYVPLPRSSTTSTVTSSATRSSTATTSSRPWASRSGWSTSPSGSTLASPSRRPFNAAVRTATRFTVVANHFKSKSAAPTGDNVDTGDGQGQWNGDRVRQAASLATFVDRTCGGQEATPTSCSR